MLNKVILMGRFTRDPELRYTQNNTAVASFTLAVNRDKKGANGESVEVLLMTKIVLSML